MSMDRDVRRGVLNLQLNICTDFPVSDPKMKLFGEELVQEDIASTLIPTVNILDKVPKRKRESQE